jgi:ring-1,2-phenylacetyl-CoA epoxidase subunit PaaD
VVSAHARLAAAWRALGGVPDPEVPAVSIVELGIVRDVVDEDGGLRLVLTPTYSGCPATAAIEAAACDALAQAGVTGAVSVEHRLAPPWTTDWMAPEARDKLRDFGIAPPGPVARSGMPQGVARVDVSGLRARPPRAPVPCPRCGSARTALLSQFGSTACKAQWRCLDCLEPFDHFKPH